MGLTQPVSFALMATALSSCGGGGADNKDGGAISTGSSFWNAVSYSSATSAVDINLENGSVTGGDGNDTLINITSVEGSNYNDQITGDELTNYLWGGNGNDIIDGGAGDDTFVIDSASDRIIENTSEGTDLIQSSVTYRVSRNVENLTLTGKGNISGYGNSLANTLTGNDKANKLYGKSGDDKLYGGSGADKLYGQEGDDKLYGGSSADKLYGQEGDDYLSGGSSKDTLSGGDGNDELLSLNID